MKKITRQMLEQLVLNEYESFMNTIKEQTIKENTMTKSELSQIIRTILSEKITGESFNKLYDFYENFKNNMNQISKSKWIRLVQGLKEKDGVYQVTLIGNGNKKLVIKWDSTFTKDKLFYFTTGELLVAGDEFSTKLYEFMLALIIQKDIVIGVLEDAINIYSSLIESADSITDIDEEEIINNVDNDDPISDSIHAPIMVTDTESSIIDNSRPIEVPPVHNHNMDMNINGNPMHKPSDSITKPSIDNEPMPKPSMETPIIDKLEV